MTDDKEIGYEGYMGVGMSLDGCTPFTATGGLRYGFGFAMPHVMGISVDDKGRVLGRYMGVHYWMAPWRRKQVYGKYADLLPPVGWRNAHYWSERG